MTPIKPMVLAVLLVQIVVIPPAGAADKVRVTSIPISARADTSPQAVGGRYGDTLAATSLRKDDAQDDSLTDPQAVIASQTVPSAGSRHSGDGWLMAVLSIAIVGAQLKRKQRLLGHRLR